MRFSFTCKTPPNFLLWNIKNDPFHTKSNFISGGEKIIPIIIWFSTLEEDIIMLDNEKSRLCSWNSDSCPLLEIKNTIIKILLLCSAQKYWVALVNDHVFTNASWQSCILVHAEITGSYSPGRGWFNMFRRLGELCESSQSVFTVVFWFWLHFV